MITLRRITDEDDKWLDTLLALYEEAFPFEERRERHQLKDLIKKQKNMHFNAIEESGDLCGLFVYWDFDSFRYLEHLAVFSDKRNKKIGQQVLDYVSKNLKGVRILEVEPTVDEITTRRVNYYRRNGYEVIERNYIQPTYSGDLKDSIPLWIMGNPEAVNYLYLLEDYIRTIKKEVYFFED